MALIWTAGMNIFSTKSGWMPFRLVVWIQTSIRFGAMERRRLLPWQSLSVGVDSAFLLRERQRAYQGLVTPDCRQGCAGCGANRLLEEVTCDA